MPRQAKSGRSWITVALKKDDIDMLKFAARKQHRSLSNYLEFHLSELAAKIDLDTLADPERMAAAQKQREAEPASEPNAAPVHETDYPGLTVRNPPKPTGGTE
jgi:hypothetical protein